ncbi:hypothetical protein DAMA08_009720 [Martiniozyma asiatica (nom. inval.)]|nr:hypothetical protein DAMA08_009720 [Martiniozyma asiatica]
MKWTTSSVLTLNKSKFKAFVHPLSNNNEIPHLINQLQKLDKKILKATHPTMFAWKTAKSNHDENLIIKKLVNLNQGINDCGEGGSGDRIMGLLDRLKIVNVFVVVSRWYGGSKLGSDRFKCISDVAIEALNNGNYILPKDKANWIDALQIKKS